MKKKSKFQVFELEDVGGYSPEGTNQWKLMENVTLEEALLMGQRKTLLITWENSPGIKGSLVVCSSLDKQRISDGVATSLFKKISDSIINIR